MRQGCSSRREKPSFARACASRSAGSVAPRPGMAGGGSRRSANVTKEEAATACESGNGVWCVL